MVRYVRIVVDIQPVGAAAIFVILCVITMCLFGCSIWATWPIALTMALAGFGNEVHTWNHRSDAENHAIARFLQDAGLVQSKLQHGKHHRKPYDKYYCTLTNINNAILERIHFWRTLEWLILVVFRIPVKRGDPERNGY